MRIPNVYPILKKKYKSKSSYLYALENSLVEQNLRKWRKRIRDAK